jgi:hypothetical protein
MENPFELILERLDRIEKAIEQLSANGPLAHTNDPMDIKALSAYVKTSHSYRTNPFVWFTPLLFNMNLLR